MSSIFVQNSLFPYLHSINRKNKKNSVKLEDVPEKIEQYTNIQNPEEYNISTNVSPVLQKNIENITEIKNDQSSIFLKDNSEELDLEEQEFLRNDIDDMEHYDEMDLTSLLSEETQNFIDPMRKYENKISFEKSSKSRLKKNFEEGDYLNAFLNSGTDILNVPKISWIPIARGVSSIFSWFDDFSSDLNNEIKKPEFPSLQEEIESTKEFQDILKNYHIVSSHDNLTKKIEIPKNCDSSYLLEKHHFSDKNIGRFQKDKQHNISSQLSLNFPWKILRASNHSLNTAILSDLMQKAYEDLSTTNSLDERFLNSIDDTNYIINGKLVTNENPQEVMDLIKKEIPNFNTQQLLSIYAHSGLLQEPLRNLELRYPNLDTQNIFDMLTTYEINEMKHGKLHVTITRLVDLYPSENPDSSEKEVQKYGLRTDMILTKYANPFIKYSYFVS